MQHYVDSLGAQYSEDKSVLGSIPKGLERYEIIEGCTVLSATALENGESLKELVLPASFQILVLGDFDHCPNLERLVIRSEDLVTVKPLDRGKHFQTIDFVDFFNQYPHIKEIYVPEAVKADYSTLLQPVVKSIEEYGIAKNNNAEKYHWYYDFLFYPEQDPTYEGSHITYIKFSLNENTCNVYLYDNGRGGSHFSSWGILRDCTIEENIESKKTILKPLTQENSYDIQYSMISIDWVCNFPFEISFYKDGNKHNSYCNAIFPSLSIRNYIINNNDSRLYEDLSLITSDDIKDLKSYVGKDTSIYLDVYVDKQEGKISKRDYASIKGIVSDLEKQFQVNILYATQHLCSSINSDGFDIFVVNAQGVKQYGYELFTLRRIHYIYHILNYLLNRNSSMKDSCKNYYGLQNDVLKLLNLNNFSVNNFEDIQEMFLHTWGMILQCGANEMGKMVKFVVFIPVNNISGYYERVTPVLSTYKSKINEISIAQSTQEAIKESIIIAASCIAKEIIGTEYAYQILDINGIDRLYIELFVKSDLQSEFSSLVMKNINEHPNLKSKFRDLMNFYFDLKECSEKPLGKPNANLDNNFKGTNNGTIQKTTARPGCVFFLSAIIVILLTIFL